MSTFDQIENPRPWGYSGYEPEWYNRKQCVTIFNERPHKSGVTIAAMLRHQPTLRVLHQEVIFRLLHPDVLSPIRYVFTADGRAFADSAAATLAIYLDLERGAQPWEVDCSAVGVVYQGTPLGAYVEPVLA